MRDDELDGGILPPQRSTIPSFAASLKSRNGKLNEISTHQKAGRNTIATSSSKGTAGGFREMDQVKQDATFDEDPGFEIELEDWDSKSISSRRSKRASRRIKSIANRRKSGKLTKSMRNFVLGDEKRPIDVALQTAWMGNPETMQELLNIGKLIEDGGENEENEWWIRLTRISGKAGQRETLAVLLANDRIQHELDDKRPLDLESVKRQGFKYRVPIPTDIDFLGKKGFMYEQTPKEQLLANICRGGKVETAKLFFASIGAKEAHKISQSQSIAGGRKATRIQSLREQRTSLQKMRFSARNSIRRTSERGGMLGLSVIDEVRLKLEEDLTFLAVAAKRGHLPLIQYLTDKIGFDLLWEGQTTLNVAARAGKTHVVEYILHQLKDQVKLTVENVCWSETESMAHLWIINSPKGGRKVVNRTQNPAAEWNNSITMCDHCHDRKRQFVFPTKQLCRKCALEVKRTTGEDHYLELSNVDVYQQLEDALLCLDVEEDYDTEFYDVDGTGFEDFQTDRKGSLAKRLWGKTKEHAVEHMPYRVEASEKLRTRLSMERKDKKARFEKNRRRHEKRRIQVFALVIQGAVENGSLRGNKMDTVLAVTVALTQWMFIDNRIVKLLFNALGLVPNECVKDIFLWSVDNNPRFALFLVEASSDSLGLTQGEVDLALANAESYDLVDHLATRFDRPAINTLFDEAIRYENYGEALEILRKHGDGLNFKRTDHLLQVINRGESRLALALLAHDTCDPWYPNNKPFVVACELGLTVIVRLFLKNPGYILLEDTSQKVHDSDTEDEDGEDYSLLDDDENDEAFLCNRCRTRIKGTRYHCVGGCDNFDLCQDCLQACARESDDGKHRHEDTHTKHHATAAINNEVVFQSMSEAVRNNHLAIVKLLADDPRFNPSIHLHEAVSQNLPEMTRLLLDICGDAAVFNATRLLHTAIMKGAKIVKELLVDDRFVPPPNSALYLALQYKNDSIVEMLLSKGVPIDWDSDQPDKILPMLIQQEPDALDDLLAETPEDSYFELDAVRDPKAWEKVTPSKLLHLLSRPQFCPETPGQALGLVEQLIRCHRNDLLAALVSDRCVAMDIVNVSIDNNYNQLTETIMRHAKDRSATFKTLGMVAPDVGQDHGMSNPYAKQAFTSAAPNW